MGCPGAMGEGPHYTDGLREFEQARGRQYACDIGEDHPLDERRERALRLAERVEKGST